MAITPIAFGDDAARLVKEGYKALSRKLNGKTVYQKVVFDPVKSIQKTEFALLGPENKVCDIFERSVGKNSSYFEKFGKEAGKKFQHSTLRGKHFTQVSEIGYKGGIRDYDVHFRFDKQGNICFGHYHKGVELPSFYGDKTSYINCHYHGIDPGSIYTFTNAKALSGKFPNVHRGLMPNDPKMKFSWHLSEMRSPNKYVEIAENATGPKLAGHYYI